MSQLTPVYERIPLVWVLVGLLLNATGLWLGFEFTMSFVYMVVGWFCCGFGLAMFALRFRNRASHKSTTRLAPGFVSDNPQNDMAPVKKHAEVDESATAEDSDGAEAPA